VFGGSGDGANGAGGGGGGAASVMLYFCVIDGHNTKVMLPIEAERNQMIRELGAHSHFRTANASGRLVALVLAHTTARQNMRVSSCMRHSYLLLRLPFEIKSMFWNDGKHP